MTKEVLKRATEIASQIETYEGLLSNYEDKYYWTFLEMRCANSSDKRTVSGVIPKEVRLRIMGVLREEKAILEKELSEL